MNDNQRSYVPTICYFRKSVGEFVSQEPGLLNSII